MSIPNIDTLTLPILKQLLIRTSTTTELVEAMARLFNLTDEERREQNPTQKGTTKFANLVHFALKNLTEAKLITRLSPKTKAGHYEISERGRTEMLDPPEQISQKYLKNKYPDAMVSKNNLATLLKPDLASTPAEPGKFAVTPAATASIMPIMSPSTNLILHGPPGTGKTFSTAAEAVRLCDGALPESGDNTAVRSRYAELVNARQVHFVTFHQSYSYEDFVEGLRPTTGEDDGVITTGGFRLEPVAGVFRKIATDAELARRSAAQGRRGNDFDLAGRRFWKMGLGVVGSDENFYRAAIEGGYVALGWGADVNWSEPRFASEEEMRKEWAKRYPEDRTPSQTSQPWHLRNKVNNRDLVIVPYGNFAFRAVAEVVGDYYFELSEDGTYNHRRKVRWLLTLDKPLPLDTIVEGSFTMRTLYEIPEHRIRKETLIRLISRPEDAHKPTPPDQFVLVIDEINRADISKVFGELITLIEPDKRIGADYELKATLPYSNESFGVPDNLHIVGTMNTADRSIALLDTALRRRFAFRELMPQPELLGTVDGIQLNQLLTIINERIEYLFDREHQIGHAFFMRCQSRADIDDVMRSKVIPLLAEYFYDDWNKIAVVLGDADDGEGDRDGGFLDRRRLKAPTGAGGDGEASPRYRWKVRDMFDYALLQ